MTKINIEVRVTNSTAKILSKPWEVRQRLASLGLSEEVVRRVALAAGSAKASTIDVDPSGTPGQLSYIYGVRQVRLELLPLGWKLARFNNVESTVNHDLGVQIVFQNVDAACTVVDPEAISVKGAASRKLVFDGQMELFGAPVLKMEAIGSTPRVWLLCVSSGPDGVRAEISCPKVFEGNQFEGFGERIWVVNEELSPRPDRDKRFDADEGYDFDVMVSKK